MINHLKKWTHRTIFASKVAVSSLAILGFRRWTKFWAKKGEDGIELKPYKFKIRNSTFLTKLADTSILFEILKFNHYKLCEIKPKDTIIDIGAHIGGFSISASDKAKEGKVIAIEPSPETFNYLIKNIGLNDKKNIIPLKVGIGRKEGMGELYINEKNIAENSVYKKSAKKVEIKLTTLEKIFKEHKIKKCDVLKIDAEGAEYDILFSSKKILPKIEKIVLEYHEPKYFSLQKEYSVKKLAQFLTDNNFEVKIKRDTYYQGIIYAQKINHSSKKCLPTKKSQKMQRTRQSIGRG